MCQMIPNIVAVFRGSTYNHPVEEVIEYDAMMNLIIFLSTLNWSK